MAVDTAARRASVQAYTFGIPLPVPDGSVDEADRAHLAWLYRGLEFAEPVIVEGVLFFYWFFYRVRWLIWPR